MSGATVTLTGVPELLAALKGLGEVGSRAALQGALKKGAEVTAVEARRLAPRGTEPKTKTRLANSIKVMANLSRSQKRKRGARRAEAEIFVGPTVPHAHLVEFGHVLVKARHEGKVGLVGRRGKKRKAFVKTKRVIGHVPAHPFMRPAFDSTKERAAREVFKELGAELKKVARRYRGQAARGKLTRGSRQAFKVELGL